jgi:hypothetical protein
MIQRHSRIRYFYQLILIVWSVLIVNAHVIGQTLYDEQPNNTVIGETEITYFAVENDTLSRIAIKFTNKIGNWEAIGKINNIKNDRTIPIGTSIKIPNELLPDVPSIATVVAIAGTVTETKNNASSPLGIGSIVQEGSQITTDKNGFITLALPDGSRVSIPSNSQVLMAKLRMSRYTKSPRTEIKLIQGRVESKVTPLVKNKGRYEVTSPLAIAGVRGTHFRVGLVGDSTANEVLAGGVAVGQTEKPNALVLPAGKGNIIDQTSVGKATDLLPPPSFEIGYALQERLTLQFNVLPQTGAVNYRAQISLDAASQNVIAESMAQDARIKFNDIEDGQYFIKVTAIDRQGLEGIPALLPFTVKAHPEPPFMLAPKKKVRGESVTFNWSEPVGAKVYHLQVALDINFKQIQLDQNNITNTELNVPLALGNYFWRVATIIETNQKPDHGPFSIPESFQLLEAQKMNPVSDTGSDELEFSWPSEPLQQFLVEISEDADFKKLYLSKETKEANLKIPRPSPSIYFIRVRATDADGFVGRFSSAQKFEIFQRWTTGSGDVLQSTAGAVRPNQYNK